MTTTQQAGTQATLEGLYRAFAAGDIPSVLAAFDPQIEWTEAEGGPYAGTYTGPDAVLENVFGRIGAEWTEFAAVPDAYVCAGNDGVVIGTYRGTLAATGRSMAARFAHVWSVRDGRAVRFEQVTDTVAWRSAID